MFVFVFLSQQLWMSIELTLCRLLADGLAGGCWCRHGAVCSVCCCIWCLGWARLGWCEGWWSWAPACGRSVQTFACQWTLQPQQATQALYTCCWTMVLILKNAQLRSTPHDHPPVDQKKKSKGPGRGCWCPHHHAHCPVLVCLGYWVQRFVPVSGCCVCLCWHRSDSPAAGGWWGFAISFALHNHNISIAGFVCFFCLFLVYLSCFVFLSLLFLIFIPFFLSCLSFLLPLSKK